MKNSGWMVTVLLTAIAGSNRTDAQTISGPTVYRLDQNSSFQQGCFPPCLCPVTIGEPLKGTFLLTPTAFDGLFNTYAVTELNWLVALNGTNQIVTGSGTYKIGGEFALQQELTLDLQLGPGQAEHFDSGLAAVSAPFPQVNVSISMHGQVCFDRVFSVSASPAPMDQILSYQLLSTSTFQRGCFGACDCALGPLEPIVGTFALVTLEETQASREFSVINVNWFVGDISGTLPVSGSGFYQIIGKSDLQQQLFLTLTIDKEAATYFDSGLVPNDSAFPLLDAAISVRGAVCFNTWMNLHAAPASARPAVRPAKARPSVLNRSE